MICLSELQQLGKSHEELRVLHRAMGRMYSEGYGPKEIGEFFNRNKRTVVYAVQRENN